MRLVRLALVLSGLLAASVFSRGAVAEDLATISRGGRLYDNFHLELQEHARRISHLANAKVGGAAGALVNRCVECHGWDYRGSAGATPTPARGIAALDGGSPARVAAVLADATHNYAAVLEAQDIEALAQFVTRGQIDMAAFIDPKTGAVDGNPERGALIYQTICANCHGTDGQANDNMPAMRDFARANPWHALHSMLNGHPGGSMPSLRALPASQLADTLAYIQTLPSRSTIASTVRGGRLYDNWMKETGRGAPEGMHPAYAALPAKPADLKPSATWRCVECHGWDYLGKDGRTAEGGHKAPFGGLRKFAGGSTAAVRKVLDNDVHRMGGLLSERDKTDLANFVTAGQVDMARFIDYATWKFRGDPPAGEPFYHTICAGCHGADGRAIRTMPPLGRMANEDPLHALHGIQNGHPGESMPPLRAVPDEVVAAVLAYAQTLPTRK